MDRETEEVDWGLMRIILATLMMAALVLIITVSLLLFAPVP